MQYGHGMNQQPFHIVLVRGRWAKVIPEDGFKAIPALENDGWQVIWDSARSPEEGYRYAASAARCLQEDYQDDHRPKAMAEPHVLFRSVSLPELLDIATRGAVSGRGNAFNEFDSRPFAFFGDRVTDSLIFQGEDVDRQAMTALSGEQVFLEFADVRRRALAASEAFAAACVDLARSGTKLRNPPAFDSDLRLARQGSALAIARLANGFYQPQPELRRLKSQVDGFEAGLAGLRRRFEGMAETWKAEETAARADYPFTSAIIETRPLSHGFHYSSSHGLSGMGDDDEFGFHRDSVLLDDVVLVHCVKEGRICHTAETGEIETLCSEISEFTSRAPRQGRAAFQRA